MIIVTPAIEAEMLSLRRQGYGNRQIAKKLELSVDTVYRHIGTDKQRGAPPEIRNEIKVRYVAGESARSIAEAVGLSTEQINYYLRQFIKHGELTARRQRGKTSSLRRFDLAEIVKLGDVERMRKFDIIPNRNIRGLTADEYARLIEVARAGEEQMKAMAGGDG